MIHCNYSFIFIHNYAFWLTNISGIFSNFVLNYRYSTIFEIPFKENIMKEWLALGIIHTLTHFWAKWFLPEGDFTKEEFHIPTHSLFNFTTWYNLPEYEKCNYKKYGREKLDPPLYSRSSWIIFIYFFHF